MSILYRNVRFVLKTKNPVDITKESYPMVNWEYRKMHRFQRFHLHLPEKETHHHILIYKHVTENENLLTKTFE